MKLFKSISIALLLTFGLSGCYTQLQYTQTAERVSDKENVEEYSWDANEQAHPNEGEYGDTANETDVRGEEEYYEDQGDIPLQYKDYETARYWDNCNCNPYAYDKGYLNGYNDAAYYGPSRPYYSSSFSFGFGQGYRPYFGSRFSFSFGFGHRPFYGYSPYYSYYDPFFYDPFFYRPYRYGFGYGYGYGYGYGRYGYSGIGFGTVIVNRNEPDRRYGRRGSSSDGRVKTRGTRVGTRSTTERSVRSRSNDGVRQRSTSGSRSRGEVKRTRTRSRGSGRVKSTRTRSSGSSSGSVGRSRSGSRGSSSGSVGRSRSGGSSRGTRSRGGSVNRDRNDNESISRVGFLDTRREQIRTRTLRRIDRSETNRNLQNVRRPNRQQSSGGFWNRLKRTFTPSGVKNSRNYQNGTKSRFNSRSKSRSRPAVRSRSSSSSRSSDSSVKRSSSRSSKGSRSRSGGSRSRSRDNN